MTRKLIDRIHDRVWTEISSRRTLDTTFFAKSSATSESVSQSMAWPHACAEYACGTRSSVNFRRERAVREVVETLAPSDARHHAANIRAWNASILDDIRVRKIDNWGNPIRWPSYLLGTPHSFSPTTLRYLSHALWLRREGLVKQGGTIVEIGVGYGGLAAMNAIVSSARTILVDLPSVENAAFKMLTENGLSEFAETSGNAGQPDDACVVSNYAFSELNTETQDHYLERYIRNSAHGMILSNANVFAGHINGYSDDEVLSKLQQAGLAAIFAESCELQTSADHACGVRLLRW